LDYKISQLLIKEQVVFAFPFETNFLLTQKLDSLYKIIVYSQCKELLKSVKLHTYKK